MRLDLVTIGDLNMDTLMRVPRFPGEDAEVQVTKIECFAGGDAANIAVAASRLGLRTALIASVGRDADGLALLEELNHHGVNTGCIQTHETEKTGSAICMVRHDGERIMFTYRGANQRLSLGPDQIALFHQSRAIHVSDPLPGIVKPLCRALRASESLISFDPGSITASRKIKAILPLLRQTKIFLANKVEYLLLTGKKTLIEAVNEILSRGPQIAVVKLGRKGCTVITDGENISVPSFHVRTLDSTGAGDAFDAAFLTGILEDMPLLQVAKFANAVGALATTQIGTQTGLPTRAQVQQFISGQ